MTAVQPAVCGPIGLFPELEEDRHAEDEAFELISFTVCGPLGLFPPLAEEELAEDEAANLTSLLCGPLGLFPTLADEDQHVEEEAANLTSLLSGPLALYGLHEPALVEPSPTLQTLVTKRGGSTAAVLCEAEAPNRILAVNAKWQQLCGFPNTEAIGKQTQILHGHLTDTEQAAKFASQLFSTGAAQATLVNYTKQKEPFVHSLEAKSVRDDAGNEYFLIQGEKVDDAALADKVTAQSKTKAVSRRSRAQLEAVFLATFAGALAMAAPLAAQMM